MTEKLILITLMHENTHIFSLSPFLNSLEGLEGLLPFALLAPPPPMAPPLGANTHQKGQIEMKMGQN